MRSLLLTVSQIIAYSFLVVASSFAQTTQFDLSPPSSIEAKIAGDTVVVPLTLSNTAGVSVKAFGLRFFYPHDKLAFQRVEGSGTLTADWIIVDGRENTSGKITIGGFNTTAVTTSGVLLNVIFTTTVSSGPDSLRLRDFVDDISTATTIDGALNPVPSGVRSETVSPIRFSLSQNYPNPFNPETRIRFDIPNLQGGKVRVQLSVYNLFGQLVRTLVNEDRLPGVHEINWDGRSEDGIVAPSGIYFYTVRAAEFKETKRMLFVR